MGALNLLQDLTEVVALGGLERWELLVGLQMPQPQLLTDRQKVEIVLERGIGAPMAPPITMALFTSTPTACSKGSRLMFCTKVMWKDVSGRIQPSGPGCDMV